MNETKPMMRFSNGPDAVLRLAVQALADELLCQKAATATMLAGEDCICMACHGTLVREYGLSLRADNGADARAALTKICVDAEAEVRRGAWAPTDEADQAAESLGDWEEAITHG